MNVKIVSFLLFTIISLGSFAQKKSIDYTVYDSWKTLSSPEISSSGNFVYYQIKPYKGDGILFLYNHTKEKINQFSRGEKATLNQSENLLAFMITPGYDTLRNLELAKVKKEKWVKDSLGLYWIKKDTLTKIPNVLTFSIPKFGNVIGYTVIKDSLKVNTASKKIKKTKKSAKEKPEIKSDGNTLFVLNPENLKVVSFSNVKDFKFNDDGSLLFFTTHEKTKDSTILRAYLYDIKQDKKIVSYTRYSDIGPFKFTEKGNQLAFMASLDTAKQTRLYAIYSWKMDGNQPTMWVSPTRVDFQNNLTPSPNGKLEFSQDGKKLFFGLYERPQKEFKDTLLDSEKAKLDVWHYQDKRNQPQQLKELKKDQKKSFLTVFHIVDNSIVQLENDTLAVSLLDKGNTRIGYASSNAQYEASYNWVYPWPEDSYFIDLESGKIQKIKDKIEYPYGISPKGTRYLYYKENQYYSIDLKSQEEICITCSVKDVIWYSDINGQIYDAEPEGVVGYTNEDKLLINSRYDIWEYDFERNQLRCVTQQIGEKNTMVLRILNLEKDSTFIHLSNTLVKGVNQETYEESIYRFNSENILDTNSIYMVDNKMIAFAKSTLSDKIIFRQMDVKNYPEVYYSSMNLQKPQKISETNPQQEEYIWPTVEMIHWTSYEGEKLKGLVYKPEDFDSSKSYPLIVYYYERSSDMKNMYSSPRPTASIIYPTEYTSAGYIVFMPDINYKPGYPGKSAYNCIMSGTDEVLRRFPNIDSMRMGLQGQSWGGYQTAHLVTLTHRYKAAMAGAPVSNMISAYGGIRWGMGINRAFQYEHGQSRIGATIWEKPDLYIENSPLFGVPNITTPLLIMSNDNDGAVPWYQGIEMFMAMKRMGKQVWMLNYNGDEHNLMKEANRIDLSIRMRQFFDYYLLNKPAPKWLIDGVPALQKGKENRLEMKE